jgi:Lon protease-like protein
MACESGTAGLTAATARRLRRLLPLTSKEKKELAELRRDKRRLELEVEILKRAAATSHGRMFSQTSFLA